MGGDYRYSISISDRLVNNYDSNMFCGSLSELAAKLKSLSRNIIRDDKYSGVEITVVNGKEIRVFDNDFDNHIDKDSKKRQLPQPKSNPDSVYRFGRSTDVGAIWHGQYSLRHAQRHSGGDYVRMPEKLRPMIQAPPIPNSEMMPHLLVTFWFLLCDSLATVGSRTLTAG